MEYIKVMFKKLFSFFVIISLSCFSNADIIKTKDYKTIIDRLDKADKDTMVLLDISGVLIIAKDKVFHPKYKDISKKLISEFKSSTSSEEEFLSIWSKLLAQHESQLIDHRIVPTVNKLKERNIQTFILTNCFTGKIGDIAKFEDLKILNLKKLGIDLQNDFTHVNFQHSKEDEFIPMFKSGIIFCAFKSKGEVFKEFLSHFKLQPKKIIFVDDKLKNLKSVQKIADNMKIEFLGIEYKGAKDLKVEPLDLEKAKFQFDTLKEKHIWLSDEEVDKIYMDKKN